MKFSYSLIKRLLPKAPSSKRIMEEMNLHAFEVESVEGDTLEIKLPANRYSDASSHIGIAREVGAIFGLAFKSPVKSLINIPSGKKLVRVEVKERQACPRYMVRYFEISKLPATPDWMKKSLKSCGVQSINGVVDLMNYVMLEVGQPLHAFDADKLDGKIIVRKAKAGEKMTTLDDKEFELSSSDLLISDESRALAIAGIKGGKYAGVEKTTKRIVVEAASFDYVGIFKTSRSLKLSTDASARFAHNLSPELAGLAMDRVTELLVKSGARLKDSAEFYPSRVKETTIYFDLKKFEKLTGESIEMNKVKKYFNALGFYFDGKKVKVPAWRTDVSEFEDLAEELSRMVGFGGMKSVAPVISVKPTVEDEIFSFSSKFRHLISRMGFDEVLTPSFVGDEAEDISKDSFFGSAAKNVEVLNAISEDKKYMRRGLTSLLVSVLEENSRFFEEAKIFEIGNVFAWQGKEVKEKLILGLAVGGKKKKESVLLVKGAMDEALRSVGITDCVFEEDGGRLTVKVGDRVVGFLRDFENFGKAKGWILGAGELDLSAVIPMASEEFAYKSIPKYPAIMRDISLVVDGSVRIGDILEEISLTNDKLIADVDLVDEYWDEKFGSKQSLTFRVVFQSDDHTLTDGEVNAETENIVSVLREKFQTEIR